MNDKPLSSKKWYNFATWAPALMAYVFGLLVAQIEGAFASIAGVVIGGVLSVVIAIMVDRLTSR